MELDIYSTTTEHSMLSVKNSQWSFIYEVGFQTIKKLKQYGREYNNNNTIKEKPFALFVSFSSPHDPFNYNITKILEFI